MCLLALAWKAHPDFPLVVCANRDEYYSRPTQTAHFWADYPQIFAGRDLQAGGSWIGISRNGRFAAITNIRNPKNYRADASSRGELVSNFLKGEQTALDYCNVLQSQGENYNGYNLLVCDGQTMVYQSNKTDQPEILPEGIYGLSNATLDITWPKTRSATGKLKQWLNHPNSAEQLAVLLNDRTVAADETLPQTGVSQELERVLSSEFISQRDYGTRCSTAVLVERTGRAEFYELSYDEVKVSHQIIDDLLPG